MTRRDLAALLTVVVVAVPGLAIAQDAGDAPDEDVEATETPSPGDEAGTDPSPTPSPGDQTESEPASEESPARQSVPEQQAVADDEEPVETDETDEDAGHGEAISALARCLPSGRELHGTGWTRGAIVSQAASTGEVVLDDEPAMPVTTPEDARAVCTLVEDRVADVADDGDETGPVTSDRGPERDARGRGGPPDHAPAHGARGRG